MLVNIVKCIGFYVYHRSYSLCSPVITPSPYYQESVGREYVDGNAKGWNHKSCSPAPNYGNSVYPECPRLPSGGEIGRTKKKLVVVPNTSKTTTNPALKLRKRVLCDK